MRRLLTALLIWVVFIAAFGTSAYYQNIGMKRVLQNTPFYDTWQLGGRSGKLMKLLALRYDMVAADFLWLRSIQSFGGRGMSNRDWRPIYNQFDTITDLDPYFKDAYTFGNLVLGDEGGHAKPAMELLNKGTFKIFRQYRIPFEAMYVAHWQMHDEDLARWYGIISSKRVDAPEWVARMVAYIDVSTGEYYIGFDRFVGNLMQSIDANEPSYQDIALNKAAETINKWNAQRFMKATDEFTSQTGHLPASIDDLAKMPALQSFETASMARMLAATIKLSEKLSKRGIPEDTLARYAPPDPTVLAQPMALGNKADSTKMEDFQDVVFRDSLTTVTGIPPSPTGQPYMINLLRLGKNKEFKPEEIFVPADQMANDAKDFLAQLRSQISLRRVELKRPPLSLKEVFYTDFNTTEPYGGKWLYDAKTGNVQMSTHPDF